MRALLTWARPSFSSPSTRTSLVPRSGAEANFSRKLRIVRAVLIDLEKKEIVKTVDWRVPDSGRYLWPIGENQVLIHVGQELRVYGPGLQLRNQISLGGPLAFVRISPASQYFAAGILHERHSREIHRQLEDAELREPEEDVEIRLLDSQFRVLTSIMRSSRVPPPVLLNEGEVHISSIGRKPLANRGEQLGWTATGSRRRYFNLCATSRECAGKLAVRGRLRPANGQPMVPHPPRRR